MFHITQLPARRVLEYLLCWMFSYSDQNRFTTPKIFQILRLRFLLFEIPPQYYYIGY